MNLKEKNEQIALMLGWRQGHIDPLEQRWKNQWFTSHGNSHKILLFRLDWNWIMIAVEFIESIQDGIYQVDILQEGCKISLHCTNTFIDETVSKASEPQLSHSSFSKAFLKNSPNSSSKARSSSFSSILSINPNIGFSNSFLIASLLNCREARSCNVNVLSV